MLDFKSVSIVTISHNEEKNIKECIDSLVSMDYPKQLVEIIVVDSSEDSTKKIVSKYSDVKLISSDYKSFSVKRNLGFREARHEIIAFVDADCIVPKDWLKKITPKLNDGKVAAVAGDAFPPPSSSLWETYVACLGKPSGGAIGFDAMVKKLENGVEFVGTNHAVFKKSVLCEVGGFDERKGLDYGGEDVEISKRITAAGYVLEYEQDAFIYHKSRDVKEFVRWSFRNGMADYFQHVKSKIKIFFGLFSIFWLFVGVLLLFQLELLPMPVVLGLVTLPLFFGMIVITAGKKLFPTGVGKVNLLIERRKRIGIGKFSIFYIVIPMIYIDRVIMNCAGIYCVVREVYCRSQGK